MTDPLKNAPERPELKLKLLAALDARTNKDVIIASSSSGIPSSQFVAECKNPERVLIGHPFNPPHLVNKQSMWLLLKIVEAY